MKIDLRWQLLLAAVCVVLVVSLLGYQIQTAGDCSTRVPASGGRLVEGIVGQPTWINPLLSQANPVDSQLVDLIFDGLTRVNASGEIEPALAQSWEVSDDGLSIRFQLRDSLFWHDGQPVTADDAVFTYGLLQNESFPAPSSLKMLWQAVSINRLDSKQIEFVLPQPYAPFLEAVSLGLLPAHLLAGLSDEQLLDHDYNRAPVGTGPFQVVPGSDWQETGGILLSPNPTYWREGAQIDTLEIRFYPDGDALGQAFSEGEIHAVTIVPTQDIPHLIRLGSLRLFTSAAPRYAQLLFNLSELASPAIRQLEVRQALAYGLNRGELVDQAVTGQGLPLEGPYLPTSWAYDPGAITNYVYQSETGRQLLDTAGWPILDDSPVRQREGEALVLRLLLLDAPEQVAVAENIAEQWMQLGVATELVAVSQDEMARMLSERRFDVALVEVEPLADPDLYDFWSQEAIVRGQNYGGWNNRWASEALEEARKLPTPQERKPYYEAFLGFYDDELPALTLFQHVNSYGLGESVNAAEVGPIHTPRDRYSSLASWFLLFRDISVECSALRS